jgi:hypothetical protein
MTFYQLRVELLELSARLETAYMDQNQRVQCERVADMVSTAIVLPTLATDALRDVAAYLVWVRATAKSSGEQNIEQWADRLLSVEWRAL